MLRPLAICLLTALTVATHSAAAGPSAGPTLIATVGPEFTITLTKDGAPVTQLAPGPYTMAVDDRSDTHDFMLVGPGGQERTEEEYRDLYDKAGFRLTRVVPTKSPSIGLVKKSGA